MAGILSLVCAMILAVFMRAGRVRAEETDEIMPDNSLPVVYLDIDESQGTVEDMITSDEHSAYCYGTVSIEVPEGFHYSDFPDLPCESVEGLAMSIRGRGNSTWQKADKKAFKIKLDKKAEIFGFGKNKHWVLLANALDETLLRDRISAWLSDQLDFEFTPRGVPVDLVIRGEEYGEHYLGSYYLSENVRVDTNRLEIDELTEEDTEEPAITGGYLLQHGLQVKDWSPDKFRTARGVSWATHTPSFDVEGDNLTAGEGEEETEPVLEENYTGAELGDAYENPVQQKYIQDYMQMVEDTLYEGGTAYRDFFDMRSAALYWWMQEFPLNADDYGTGSYYVYKKRDVDGVLGKLFTGPCWDFDFAWDNHFITEGFGAPHKWLYPMFCDQEEGGMAQEVINVWPAVRENIAEMIRDGGLIDQYYEETKNSAALDHQIWHPENTDFDYKKEVDELKDWITKRLAWVDANLDEVFNVAHTVTFMLDDEVFAVEYQEDGLPVDTAMHKVPEKEGYVFVGWEYEDGEIAESEIMVRRNIVLTAKYLSDEEVTHGDDILFRKNNDVVQILPFVKQYTINYEVIPADAIDQTVEWSVSDESFASIDSSGTVSFSEPGEVTIYAKLKNGVVREFKLTVVEGEIPKPESVYPLEETIYMTVGEMKGFIVDTVPSPAKIIRYDYFSDDKNVVTVDNYGCLTATGPGETKVRLNAFDSWDNPTILEAEITVIVTEEEPEPEPEIVYTVVSGDQSTWKQGSEDGLTIIIKRSANDEECFSHFKDVLIDGNLLERGQDYTASPGSTVITVKASALNKLAAGEHTVTAVFDDGTAETKIAVAAKDPDTAPDTSDHRDNSWPAYLGASLIVFALAFAIRRKYAGIR